MPNDHKVQIVKNLKEKLARAKGFVLTDYQGLGVPEVEELRRNLSKLKVDFQVVKNTLLKLALENSNYQLPPADYELTGPTAVLLSYDEEMRPLKALSKFSGEHQAFKIKGGFFEGIWMGAEKLLEIARLPSREELRGKLAGMLQSPIVRLARVGKGNQISLVRALQAKSQRKS